MANSSSGNAFVSEAGGSKSWASQIGRKYCQRLATAATFFRKQMYGQDAMTRPANSLHASTSFTDKIVKNKIPNST